MRLKELGESGLIKRIQGRFFKTGKQTLVGIGDDAAAVQVNGDKLFLLATDMLVEGTHFMRHTIPCYDLGYKSLAVNLSDIAAMGGTPLHALVSLGLCGDMPLRQIDSFYDGMQELAHRFSVDIVGGDITSSPGGMIISIAVTGEVEKDQLVLQGGARAGDLVAVTGELGASAAGLALLLNKQASCPPRLQEAALSKHFRPIPRVVEGRVLAGTGLITAMKDISDGLLKEVNSIATSSGQKIVVYKEQIPLAPLAVEVGRVLGADPLKMALQGGEDYELIFTFPASQLVTVEAVARNHGFTIHVIGEVLSGQGVFIEGVEPISRGYEHF